MKKNNDVFAADSDSLAIDIACYEKLFADYMRKVTAEKAILPEITAPILARYGDESSDSRPSIFRGMLYAFIGGVEAGLELADYFSSGENSNLTNIE
jgi:hypothetical protein